MIVSHKYKFIFIKCAKTAGTSLEMYLDPLCGDSDVLTPFWTPEEGHRPRNHKGVFNPWWEMRFRFKGSLKSVREGICSTLNDFCRRLHFREPLPAWQARWDGFLPGKLNSWITRGSRATLRNPNHPHADE